MLVDQHASFAKNWARQEKEAESKQPTPMYMVNGSGFRCFDCGEEGHKMGDSRCMAQGQGRNMPRSWQNGQRENGSTGQASGGNGIGRQDRTIGGQKLCHYWWGSIRNGDKNPFCKHGHRCRFVHGTVQPEMGEQKQGQTEMAVKKVLVAMMKGGKRRQDNDCDDDERGGGTEREMGIAGMVERECRRGKARMLA